MTSSANKLLVKSRRWAVIEKSKINLNRNEKQQTERNRSFCCCLKKFLHGAGKEGRNERREREKEECSATCSLNEILFLFFCMCVVAVSIDDGCVCVRGVIRSFGLVCQIRAWKYTHKVLIWRFLKCHWNFTIPIYVDSGKKREETNEMQEASQCKFYVR